MKTSLILSFCLLGLSAHTTFSQRVKDSVPMPRSFSNPVVIAIPDTVVNWDSKTGFGDVNITFYVVENNTGKSISIVDPSGKNLTPNHTKITGKMHVRGDATIKQPKKQFAVTLDKEPNDKHFLGMPNNGRHWVFNDCGTFDVTLMRNVITFDAQTKMGQYAPHYKWFELFLCQPTSSITAMDNILDSNYYGLYLNFDKITFEKDRVADPSKKQLKNGDYALIQVNQLEPTKYDELSWKNAPAAPAEVYEPKRGDLKKKKYANAFQTIDDWYTNWAAPSDTIFTNYINAATKRADTLGLHKLLMKVRNSTDYQSFATYFLINELSKDQDGYHKSTFMIKKDNTCFAGPLWDKNKSYGNTWIAPPTLDTTTQKMDSLYNIKPEGWLFQDYNSENEDANQSPQWWSAFLLDSVYCDTVWQQWKRYKNSVLNATYLSSLIDTQIAYISTADTLSNGGTNSALTRNNLCWQNGGNTTIEEYDAQVEQLNKYLKARLAWMDANLKSLFAASGYVAR